VPQGRQAITVYLLAFLATASAVIVTAGAEGLISPLVTLPFMLAVAITAVYGGRGPGMVAALLSVLALSYWFFPPIQLTSSPDLTRQLLFLTVAGAIVWIAGTAQSERELARQKTELSRLLRQKAEEESDRAQEAMLEAEMAATDAAESLALQLEAEKALRLSEAELTDFFNNASTPLHCVAADGTIIRANQAELDLLGYKRHE
jgi:K+-sensing histidine kinase KdpD